MLAVIKWGFAGQRAAAVQAGAYVISIAGSCTPTPRCHEMDLSDKRVDLIAEGFGVAIIWQIDGLKPDRSQNIKCAVFTRCRPIIG